MRLFAKFFLCAALVLCAALLLSGYLLITGSHESAISRETDRAVTQYQFDRFTVQASLITNESALRYGIPYGFFDRLAADLNALTAFISDDFSVIFSQLPESTDFALFDEITAHTHAHMFQTIDGHSYIIVGGMIIHDDLTLYLLTATDISDVVAQRDQMMQSFFRVYILTLAISMVVIFILTALLIRPINKISKAAAEIAQGNFHKRLSPSGGDEIGELSNSFNLMADAVEDKITELSKNARQKEDFVANFAHELKTPLTSVIGYADMLYQKSLSPEQVKSAAEYILTEGLRLESLSLKLMDLIVLGRHDFVLEEMDVGELIENITGSLSPVLAEKNVTLRQDLHPAFVMVEYDLFKTLILNLIDNGIKAGSSSIKITGSRDGHRYVINIIDNGKGIPDAELSRITEAFYMGDKSRTGKHHGAGLGLALSSKIAEIHGSPLDISSIESIGTTVEIKLKLSYGQSGNFTEARI
ncbi:MAG: HAMP domain-containing histidine kinase [Oscillospiraceae bacterium]|nr:HAMP domain-containing histidine kinase [Oscillospiraceae bacterium]